MSDEGKNENSGAKSTDAKEPKRERYELLQRLEGWLETPMLVLAFVWLVLLIVELVRGESLLFYFLGTTIWVVFIIDFGVKLVLAPDKIVYLKGNWLTAISLLLPALLPPFARRAAAPANRLGRGAAVHTGGDLLGLSHLGRAGLPRASAAPRVRSQRPVRPSTVAGM
ncbi:MAG TPA: hypothetical protein VFK36_10720 [Gemmatimonadales bacterium]|nr:hypothetical protein [Gemmatimonadales bacterium]